jgi:hypothetical protein
MSNKYGMITPFVTILIPITEFRMFSDMTWSLKVVALFLHINRDSHKPFQNKNIHHPWFDIPPGIIVAAYGNIYDSSFPSKRLIIGALKDTPVLDKRTWYYLVIGYRLLHRSLHSGILSAWNIIHGLIGSSYGYRACYELPIEAVLVAGYVVGCFLNK